LLLSALVKTITLRIIDLGLFNRPFVLLFWSDDLRREECQGQCPSNDSQPRDVSAHLLAGPQNGRDNNGIVNCYNVCFNTLMYSNEQFQCTTKCSNYKSCLAQKWTFKEDEL